ncbi:murein biosynthesis integral membrane protein MurJ [Rubritalea marina]|uniref:murein biosynthesis integral membrane protein MurJ n=1 Tax=Rubritalea marina TaxID=361055 RepID=UPI0003641212|nr:murein biosynthesis integral membrane protein MurJ [Rubritalea marina]
MLKSLMTVSGFTLLSRITGFLRDMLTAHYLGGGATGDVWVAAFRFPNLFRRVLGEGAFNSAFVPLYSGKLAEEGGESACRFSSRVFILLSLILSVICVVSYIFMEPITHALTKGFSPEKLERAVELSRITVSYLFFICLVAAFSGVLNSHKKFAAPAFSYVSLNLVFLAGLVGVVPFVADPVEVLAWALPIGGGVQLAIVMISAWRTGIRFIPQIPKLDRDVIKLGLLMGPGLVSAGIQQLNLLVGQWVAAFQDGGMSAIFYADRINQLPLGLIGIAFSVVLLPDITQKLRKKQDSEAQQSMETGMTMAMLIALPAMLGMMALAEPIIYGIFVSGEFTAAQAQLAGTALFAFAFGCPAYVMSKVLQTAYFAREDTKTPMKFTLVSALVNSVLCGIAFVYLGKGGNLALGCAAATSVAGWVNVSLLLGGLRKSKFLQLSAQFWKRLGKMLIASVAMGAIVWAGAYYLDAPLHHEERWLRIPVLAAVGGAGVAVYFVLAHITGAMRFGEIKRGFRRS